MKPLDSNISSKKNNQHNTVRSKTPLKLRINTSLPTRNLGSGIHAEVVSYSSIDDDHKRLAIKIAFENDDTNVPIEYLIKKTVMQILGLSEKQQNLDPKNPVVFPFDFKVSHETFKGSDGKPRNTMSMLDLEGNCLAKNCLSFDEASNKNDFLKAREKLEENGVTLKDLDDKNIFVQDSNIYMGDLGEFTFKEGSNAHNIFIEVMKKNKAVLDAVNLSEEDVLKKTITKS